MLLRQLSYAIKNQLKAPKAPTRGISCLSLVLYGIRKCSEGLVTMKYFQVLEVVAREDQDVVEDGRVADDVLVVGGPMLLLP